MSTEVASNTPVVPADPSSTPSPTTSIPTTPSTAPAKTPFKKEKKKAPEKTDEYLLSRFQGDGVRYRAKLIGIDDVPEARGDKMSQDSMMKLKGLAIASRSQGKHKQRIWVNISMSGIKIIDEKTGVIEHEHMVNTISFIARDVTDNRAFGYVCGAEGQHQFFAIKTGQQAEPLVIDLKDLFQVIFNMKKESEASQKDQRNNATVENGGNALLSIDGQAGTAKEVQQLDLFGDMSTPPDIHSPTCPPADDLFGADMFAAPSQPDSSSASNGLFSPTTSSIAALGALQLGPPSVTIPRTAPSPWGAPASSMFTMPGGVTLPNPQPTFPQPSAFSALPIPPAPWGQQMPSPYGAPPVSQAWGQPAPAGPMGAPGWGQPPMANLFQPEPYTMMGGPPQGMLQGPPRPPPRPPVKEAPAKVEPSAFTALDPLGGEKEKKSGKDMFKDFQIAKPPAIPARKGEQIPGSAAPSTNGDGVFAQYFSSKVGVPQEIADYDDFEIQSRISIIANDPPKPAPLHSVPMISLAVVPGPGLLDAFAPTPATFLAPAAAGLNQNLFDDVFGSATPNAFGAPLLATTTGGSDPFGDPFA
ncbi:disabled homolog 2 isoform X2 [Oncorhynchus kisutch]|uniref:DAB adaptor protein 2 n=1 Tax=Oncorhynchus kisutch TaxID=8019 RepID=A0A8C7CKV8_ONCKI|nr:disabled homolog 2 isoform X2 [Oncorhynchus kisutch]XP_031682136.1 disabled homolog 2 isoform X2 [Oncorhynchus kisutch]XP_031682137.1 disabled homolog 2 isoform X2 [Oncorhynchus kisutch]